MIWWAGRLSIWLPIQGLWVWPKARQLVWWICYKMITGNGHLLPTLPLSRADFSICHEYIYFDETKQCKIQVKAIKQAHGLLSWTKQISLLGLGLRAGTIRLAAVSICIRYGPCWYDTYSIRYTSTCLKVSK